MSARWAAVIVAAGRGTRFGRPKQLLDVAGRPLVAWSVAAFAAMPEVCEIVVATEAAWLDAMREALSAFAAATPLNVVIGGAIRQQSVARALDALGPGADAVLVHDGARPLVRVEEVRAAMCEVRPGRAAVLASRVVDTIERVDPTTLRVVQTLDRAQLWAAQTPQLATTADFRQAHAKARAAGVEATDDVALLQRIGVEVVVVPATNQNFKVTHPEDLARAEILLRERFTQAEVL